MNNEEKETQEDVTVNAVVPHIISLGAGVQSSTMALMAAAGEITPMPMAAIFADTQDEPQSVYKWLDWLEKQLPFPVHRVTRGRLGSEALHLRQFKKRAGYYSRTAIPSFTRNANGEQGRVPHRTCTSEFKIKPLMRRARELAGIKRGQKGVGVIQWIGISLDEIVRMREAREPWARNRRPLVEKRIRRDECLQWMKDRGYPQPPRSACYYCPFHSDAEWRRLKLSEPEAFEAAVLFERSLQAIKAKTVHFKTVPYLHRSLVPLSEVDFSTDIDRGQTAWWEENFRDECEGMCGV